MIASPESAEETGTDPQHFTKAVTELGETRPVMTTSAIFNEQGVKIVEKGVAINSGMYERLMQHKLSEPIENSVASLPTVNGEFLRETAETLLLQIPFFARMTEDPKVRALLLDVIAKIALPAPMAFQLTLACEVRHEVFIHSVQTALVAAWLARSPTALRFDVGVGMAAAAGLLHDVGMLHLDPVLLRPEHGLSGAQRRQLYSHPLIATVLLRRHPEYTKEMVRAVSEHHEYMNGSGYPRNLSGDGISPLGRILALAEVVSAMFVPDREAPEMRLSVLLRMNLHRYDAHLVTQVMHLLRPDQDAANTKTPPADDPVGKLRRVEDAVTQWPAELIKTPNLSRERADWLHALSLEAAQMLRTLANVGVTHDQLAQLGDDNIDVPLKMELTMLAAEAAWQLRAMARQTRRRWRAGPQGVYPPELQDWLGKVDELVSEGVPTDTLEGHDTNA
jgi:HD-GYP domain-containing protein (c-di-GMP phosphodiesterase class II)